MGLEEDQFGSDAECIHKSRNESLRESHSLFELGILKFVAHSGAVSSWVR